MWFFVERLYRLRVPFYPMLIKCKYSSLLSPYDPRIVPNPKNNNKHSKEQIERLSKILAYQGQRKPIIISNQSGFLITGHATLEAARALKAKSVAVDFQDFENEAAEYAHLTADNAIASWAEIDLQALNFEIPTLGEAFDVELLGLPSLDLEKDLAPPDIGDGKDSMIIQRTFTLTTEQSDLLDEAMAKAKQSEDCSDEINENENGNILTAIAKAYVIR
ncbi:MAG: hypothetical protein BWZ03_00129 [bacterium ADurb.BinA186]|nr:MAG: hypothetical protein BWZ03_00129 [bacterium ADurb.BinA186]